MTTIAEALEDFKGLDQGEISAKLSSAGIDIISLCNGTRSDNCPIAQYLSERTGKHVSALALYGYHQRGPVVYFPFNVTSWISAYDCRQSKLKALQAQHNVTTTLA